MTRSRSALVLAALLSSTLGVSATIAGCSGKHDDDKSKDGAANGDTSLLGAPERLATGAFDLYGWTTDGALVYVNSQTKALEVVHEGKTQVLLKSFSTFTDTVRVIGNVAFARNAEGETVAWTSATGVTPLSDASPSVRWAPSPDERFIAYIRLGTPDSPYEVAVKELGSDKAPQTVVGSKCQPRLTAVGDRIAVTTCTSDLSETGVTTTVQSLDPAKGFAATVLATGTATSGAPTLAKLGTEEVVFSDGLAGTQSLRAVKVKDGAARVVAADAPEFRIARDGASILYRTQKGSLERVPAAGGTSTSILPDGSIAGILSVSENGALALVYRQESVKVVPMPGTGGIVDAGAANGDAGSEVPEMTSLARHDLHLVSLGAKTMVPIVDDATASAGEGSASASGVPGGDGFSSDNEWILYFRANVDKPAGTLVAHRIANGEERVIGHDATEVASIGGYTLFDDTYVGDWYYSGNYKTDIQAVDLAGGRAPVRIANASRGYLVDRARKAIYYSVLAPADSAGIYRLALP